MTSQPLDFQNLKESYRLFQGRVFGMLEDELPQVKRMAECMIKAQWGVVYLTNQEEALGFSKFVASNHEVPKIIYDIRLKSKQRAGLDILREVKKQFPYSYAAVYTANDQLKKESFHQGADTFFPKLNKYKASKIYGTFINQAINKEKQRRIEMLTKEKSKLYDEIHQLEEEVFFQDFNNKKYTELINSDDFRETHNEKYIAIFNGELILTQESSSEEFFRVLWDKYDPKEVLVAYIKTNSNKQLVLNRRRPTVNFEIQ